VLGVNQQSTEENAAAFGVIQGKNGQQKYTKKIYIFNSVMIMVIMMMMMMVVVMMIMMMMMMMMMMINYYDADDDGELHT